MMNSEIERLKNLYTIRYTPEPGDTEYIWHPLNPVAIYYRHAQERALAELIRRFHLDVSSMQVLDIGCGYGGLLRYLASLGAAPANLHGIDLLENRIMTAHQMTPCGVSLMVGNAEKIPFTEGSFDLVAQFTVFSSVLDLSMRKHIADEIIRVLKSGGNLLWYDMTTIRSDTLHNLPLSEIRLLFPGFTARSLRYLHPIGASRIVRRSGFVCTLLEYIPGFPKTHCLALLQKP